MYKNNSEGFDLTFIGAGLSCVYTLVHFFEMLEQSNQKNRIKLCIIDKSAEFWTGIPYGNRSGANSLIITALKGFLPKSEWQIFNDWIQQNYEALSKNYMETGGHLPSKWQKNNQQLIEKGLWEEVFIPRYMFGEFLKQRMEQLLEKAEKNNLVTSTLLTAEVTNVERTADGFELTGISPSGEGISLKSKKVVLSIGSPPQTNIEVLDQTSENYLFIQNMYDQTLPENLNNIFEYLKTCDSSLKKNVLIMGSNASSLEVIYNLQNNPEAERLINKIYIISPNGMFPHRIAEIDNNEYIPSNLASLKNAAYVTCEQILEALKTDVEIANSQKTPIGEIYVSIATATMELVDSLADEEKWHWVNKYGVEVGKYQRRAGAEYLSIVDRLLDENRLQFIKGRFIKQLPSQNKSFHFEYHDYVEGQKKPFAESVQIVINCIGASDIENSPSPLIRNLLKNKICKPSGSPKGIAIEDTFESSPNFFVIGPMLAGTLTKRLLVWHAESCPRIFFLGKQLATTLTEGTYEALESTSAKEFQKAFSEI